MCKRFGYDLLLISLAIIMTGCSRSMPSPNISSQSTETPSIQQETIQPVIPSKDDIDNSTIQTPTPALEYATSMPTELIRPEINYTYADLEITTGTLMVMENIGGNLFLVNIDTGSSKLLAGGRNHFVTFQGWQDQGCNVLVGETNGDIVIYDLIGAEKGTFLAFEKLMDLGIEPYGRDVFLSPDGNWLWFWQASGRPYDEMGPESRLEFQNIYSVSFDLTEGPYRLTQRDGGWVAAWSPDSEQIAYSDYDDHSTQQVYLAAQNGDNVRKITGFDQPSDFELMGTDIQGILWSPDGLSIAVNYSQIENDRKINSVAIFTIENAQILMQESNLKVQWWIDENTIAVRSLYPSGGDISIIDIIKNEVLGMVLERDFSYIRQVYPFVDPHYIGFFGESASDDFALYVFDYRNSIIDLVENVDDILDLHFWATTPADFPGLELCNK